MNEQEGNKEEKLELVFGTENLLESAKEPFIGEVIYAEFPCNCEECKKGAATMMEKFQKEAPERLHIHIKPLTVYTEVQHNWWIPTKTKLSRWGALQEQLQTLGLMSKFKVEGFKAFRGMLAEWHWKEVEVGVTGDLKSHWLPMRILGQQETEELTKIVEANAPMSPEDKFIDSSGDVTSDASKETADAGTDASTGENSKLD